MDWDAKAARMVVVGCDTNDFKSGVINHAMNVA
jgi:hypothetical protein